MVTKSKLRSRLGVAGMAAALLAGGVVTGPAAGAATTPQLAAGVTHEVVFNDPGAPENAPEYRDYALHDRIVQLINGTPAGETIRGTIYSISTKSVADALVAAHKRGVNVYLAFGGQVNMTTGQPLRLKSTLGSRAVHCDTHTSTGGHIHACISKRSGSTMHSKMMLFSKTGTTSNVVAVTGTNWSGAQSAQYNDMLITSGDRAHYDGYVRYFGDLFAMRKNNNYTASANGTVDAPGALTFTRFSPKASSTGTTAEEAATDLVAQDLAKLRAGTDCSLRASQRYIDDRRDAIVDQVVRLASGGCDVEILYNSLPSSARDRMRAAGAKLRRVHVYHPELGYETKIHHKYYLVKGTYDGVAGTSYAFTGSHNWTGSALRSNDETLVRVAHPPTIDAYHRNFRTIWDRSA
jgi:phosphatidylserine/phosphatidylglycerophosphate/cardiolipin synthase-like enzyme